MSDKKPRKKSSRLELTLVAIVAAAAVGVLGVQYYRLTNYGVGIGESMERMTFVIETDDGRRLLWASGSYDVDKGEWFDVTDSPIEPDEYQFGIGKDTIAAIDDPRFMAIGDAEKLRRDYDINDQTEVIGFVHNGQAKAYPIEIMNRHELVNDTVGGKPVTVGW